uniref:Large ribosomal subunit protein eL19 n=1 Tax=uncultured euryarchaeote Rifle_16ft_4_minimus_309 TaxID=1665192 RepID=A0A0H4T5G9_9EURY|nr:LSU ribosomal protein L19E [uncultured euryarchaeote Rifle_16ft_4_minimus_309]
MRFDYQRRLAASTLGVGRNRVWISTDPKEQENILDAITREQIRALIKRNVIQKRPEKGVSRGRARQRAAQRAKGRRRGHGTRKGAKNARTPRKARWVGLIRAMRRRLRQLKAEGRIDVHTYRKFYMQAKGGMFKSTAHLEQQLRAAGVVKEVSA